MKKILAFLVAVCAIFLVVGCSNAKQDALIKYINEDMKAIATVETETNKLYSSVTGTNYTTDEVLLKKLKNEVITKSNELVTKSEAVTSDDTKVKDTHAIYVKAVKKQHEAFTTMVTALETKDATKMTAANKLLEEARTLSNEFTTKINELKTEYDVVTK